MPKTLHIYIYIWKIVVLVTFMPSGGSRSLRSPCLCQAASGTQCLRPAIFSFDMRRDVRLVEEHRKKQAFPGMRWYVRRVFPINKIIWKPRETFGAFSKRSPQNVRKRARRGYTQLGVSGSASPLGGESNFEIAIKATSKRKPFRLWNRYDSDFKAKTVSTLKSLYGFLSICI